MNKGYLLFICFTFFLLGAIQGILYYSLYSNHFLLAIIQWPVLLAIYTSFIFNVILKKRLFKNSIYFIVYFTFIAIFFYAICFYIGYYGFLLGFLFSGFCSLFFFKGIQLFLSKKFFFSTYKAFSIGTFAYILNMLLLIPFISGLLLPFYNNKGAVVNVISPFFIFWTFLVGTYSVICLLGKKEPPSSP